jgi:hypothetical protein
MNFTFCIILYRYRISLLFMCRQRWNQIKHELIINFKVGDLNREFVIKFASDLLKDLINSSWYCSSIFVVLSASIHCKCFSSSCLSIYHDSTIETINYRFNNFAATRLKDIFLTRIMKYLVEFKTPLFLLIIYKTSARILENLNCHSLYMN